MNFKIKTLLIICAFFFKNGLCLEIDNLEFKISEITFFTIGGTIFFFGTADAGTQIDLTYTTNEGSQINETYFTDSTGDWKTNTLVESNGYKNLKITAGPTNTFEINVKKEKENFAEIILLDLTLNSDLNVSVQRNLNLSGSTGISSSGDRRCPCSGLKSSPGFVQISSFETFCLPLNQAWNVTETLQSSATDYKLDICINNVTAKPNIAKKIVSISSSSPLPPFCVRLEDKLSLAIFDKYRI